MSEAPLEEGDGERGDVVVGSGASENIVRSYALKSNKRKGKKK